MTVPLDRPATRDGLFLWVMHRFAEVFEDHAIIKGGMVLRLLDSPRPTMDIDYVFVPFTSKKDIVSRIESVLAEIEDAATNIELHSKMLRAELRVDDAAIQIEVNVALHCETMPMSTGGFARALGRPSQVVRVMHPAHALSHKLAAWNERRLARDLYDCYFLAKRVGAKPDLAVLDVRLKRVQSRLPELRNRCSMTREHFSQQLRMTAEDLTDERISEELEGVMPPEELAGLALRIRTAILGLCEIL